jgi:coenzyme F420-reducing hydrogenase alpha subunit
MILETHLRFKDADFYNPNLTVTILGLGGIGSFLAHVLCRQGYEMFLYDFDTVELHNIGSQLYNTSHVGRNKAEVAAEICEQFGNKKTFAMGRFTEESPTDNIVFSCFDNMKYRKVAFEKWLNYQLSKTPEYRQANPLEVNVFIDMRMSAESWQVYMVKSKTDAERYKQTLFDDSEVEDAPCSYKATCQTGMGIAAYAASLFLNHVANKNKGIEIRQTYFSTIYNASLLSYEQNV